MNTPCLDPEPLKRCEMPEIQKYYEDRWTNDQGARRRSSHEDEGVEEDFSSSGSGIESHTAASNSATNNDFEELTQMMKNSLAGFDNRISSESRKASSSASSTVAAAATTKTYC